MLCFIAKSLRILHWAAEAISLFGVKWSGIKIIFLGSKTPTFFSDTTSLNTSMAIGAVMSFAKHLLHLPW